MDERKTKIKVLEEKKRTDREELDKLFVKLGESLILRIGDEEPFADNSSGNANDIPIGNTPGGVLAEYRSLQKEITESQILIKSLEEAIAKLKELEEKISAMELEHSELEEELEEVLTSFGSVLLKAPYLSELADPLKQQEESILDKIEENEKKLEELEEKKGGIFSRMGNNAKIAMTKALLSKDKSALQRFYYSAGEKFIPAGTGKPAEALEGEAAEAAEKVHELRAKLASLGENLTALKAERRKTSDNTGTDGSPSRRIQGLEKHMAQVKSEFPNIYSRLGSMAAVSGKNALSPLIRKEDGDILEKITALISQIETHELEINKNKTAISIDDEKTEIDRLKKSIAAQRQKISSAEEIIAGLEKEILQSEEKIKQMEALIQENHGSEN